MLSAWSRMGEAMIWIDLSGYAASLLVFATFCMRTMMPLRVAALGSNVCFILYGTFGHLYPVLVLHALLLPLNGWRTLEMLQATKKIAQAARGDLSLDALKPFMTTETYSKNEVIFRKHSHADCMYLVEKGELVVEEIDFVLRAGDLFGEIGMFSRTQTRTFAVRCLEDVVLQTISRGDVARITYQTPGIAFHLLTLIATRMVEDLTHLEKAKANLGNPCPPHALSG
jgi:hypothetical protein